MKEDAILLAGIEDKIRQCLAYDIITNSAFLDMRQTTLAEAQCRQQKGLHYCFSGGYEDAERRLAIFLPDYAELAEEDFLALIRIIRSGNRPLSHRDYLGSLLSLGIKREMIGDILVRDDGADIVVIKGMAEFLLCNYEKAGRTSLKAEIVSIDEIIVPENRFEEKKDTVASLRLDNLIASAFSMSRGKAAEAIAAGIVFVNGLQSDKADRQIKEGDKLVLRGKGKVQLKTVGNVTRKNRISIVLNQYI